MPRPRLDEPADPKLLQTELANIKEKLVTFNAEDPKHIARVLGRTLYILMDGIHARDLEPEHYERLIYWMGNAEDADLQKLFGDDWINSIPQEAIDDCYRFIRVGEVSKRELV